MYMQWNIDQDLYYLGCSERRLALFEGAYPVPQGISYNSYLLKDAGCNVLFDTVDQHVGEQFLQRLKSSLAGEDLHYLVVHHLEPDHAALIGRVMSEYSSAKLLCSSSAKNMLVQFFGEVGWLSRVQTVVDGEELKLTKHQLKFLMAPMVHWPEVMVSYDMFNKTLFSADAFGSFGAVSGKLHLEDTSEDRTAYLPEFRRYYTNIVGKYGAQVNRLLQKVGALTIDRICPLHGKLLNSSLSFWLDCYQKWANYLPEEPSVVIYYASIYGGTEQAATLLADQLGALGIAKVAVYDVAAVHYSYLVAEAFRASHLVFASVSYNSGLFTAMQHLLQILGEHNLSSRKFALIENGSWAPSAAKCMREICSKFSGWSLIEPVVTIKSRLKADQLALIEHLASQIAQDVQLAK